MENYYLKGGTKCPSMFRESTEGTHTDEQPRYQTCGFFYALLTSAELTLWTSDFRSFTP